MNGSVKENVMGYAARYDKNYSALELEAGITYHFGNTNGTHHFVVVTPFDQSEIDALNAQINDLRAQLDASGANNAMLMAQIADMQAQIDACNRRPPVVEKVVKDLNNIRFAGIQQETCRAPRGGCEERTCEEIWHQCQPNKCRGYGHR